MSLPPAFQHRDFRVFWSGATASAFGTQFATVAMAWQIYELTNSPLQIGLLGLARAIPQMVLALVGGVLADAADRRRLLMSITFVQLVVSTALTVLTLRHSIAPMHLYVAAMTFAACNALGQPSRQSLVPNLVPRSFLASAVALNNTSFQLSRIAGPAVGGVVLAAAGAAACYGVDAVSWIAMIGSLLIVRAEYDRSAVRGRIAFRAVAEGLGFLRDHPLLFAMVALDGAAMLFGEPRALMPIYARDLYQVGPAGLGLLFGATSVGSFTAAVGLALRGQPRNTCGLRG